MKFLGTTDLPHLRPSEKIRTYLNINMKFNSKVS